LQRYLFVTTKRGKISFSKEFTFKYICFQINSDHMLLQLMIAYSIDLNNFKSTPALSHGICN